MPSPQLKFDGGDETAGYRISAVVAQHRLNVKMWGLWKDESLAPMFKHQILICMNALSETGGWNVFGDLNGFPAQPVLVADLIKSLMQEALRKKFQKCGVVTDNIFARLLVGRLINEVGMTTLQFFKTPAEAEAYLKTP